MIPITRNLLITGFLFLFHTFLFAQKESLPSSIYEYEMIPSERNSLGDRKEYVDWNTLFFSSFNVILKTISSTTAVTDGDIDPKAEKLIIIKKGQLGIESEDFEKELGERSVLLIPKGKEVKLSSTNGLEVAYFLIQWNANKETTVSLGSDNDSRLIEPFEYGSMEFKENSKGGRRSIRQAPSSTLKELEMHITTLKEGEKSHDPHTHLDEEILLILEGEVEEMINGTPYRLGPGSLIFLASMDPHGIRNAGSGTCEYYAIRFTPFD